MNGKKARKLRKSIKYEPSAATNEEISATKYFEVDQNTKKVTLISRARFRYHQACVEDAKATGQHYPVMFFKEDSVTKTCDESRRLYKHIKKAI
jgi:hypothetical protein